MKTTRIIALLLAVLTVIAMLPALGLAAFAEEEIDKKEMSPLPPTLPDATIATQSCSIPEACMPENTMGKPYYLVKMIDYKKETKIWTTYKDATYGDAEKQDYTDAGEWEIIPGYGLKSWCVPGSNFPRAWSVDFEFDISDEVAANKLPVGIMYAIVDSIGGNVGFNYRILWRDETTGITYDFDDSKMKGSTELEYQYVFWWNANHPTAPSVWQKQDIDYNIGTKNSNYNGYVYEPIQYFKLQSVIGAAEKWSWDWWKTDTAKNAQGENFYHKNLADYLKKATDAAGIWAAAPNSAWANYVIIDSVSLVYLDVNENATGKIESAAATIGNDFGLAFYASANDGEGAKYKTLKATIGSKTVSIEGEEMDDMTYRFQLNGIAPSQLEAPISLELSIDGKVVDTLDNYTLKENLDAVIAGDADAAAKKVAVDALYYVAAVQTYEGAEATVIDDLDATAKALHVGGGLAGYTSTAKFGGTVSDEARVAGAVMQFADTNGITVALRYVLLDEIGYDVKTVIDGREVSLNSSTYSGVVCVDEENDLYEYVMLFDNFSAAELATPVTASLVCDEEEAGFTYTFCVNDVLKAVTGEEAAIADAIYTLGVSAAAYAAN